MNEYKNIIDNINNNNLDDAEKICRQTNNFENNHLIQNFLGIINAKKNKFDSAEKNFIKSFSLEKNFEQSIKNLYLLYLKQRKISPLLDCAKKLININKNDPSYNYFLALSLEFNNYFNEAVKFYKKSIDLNYVEKRNAYNNIGNILLRQKKQLLSLKYFKKAYELDKKNIHIIANLLSNYVVLRDTSNLEFYLKKLYSIDKNSRLFLNYKAELLILKNEIDQAKEILNQNLDDVRFTIKLIGIHFNTGEYQIGKDLFYKIKNKIYNDPNYNNFIATTLLYDGNFEEGFKFYDKRNSKFVREYSNINEWRGESLNNKKILVYFEQGLGDTLQFSKYIIPLLKICKNVTFLVQEKLADLYNKNIDGLNIISKINIDNENFDYKIDLGSLIKFFYKEKIDNSKLIINTQKNFIQNKFIKIDKSKLNVGIVWSGSNYGPNEPYRSISLENLKKLFSLNINFYSLQSEIRDNDAEYFKSLNINNCGNFDLNEISKIIINLDLVISTDTSILHLSAILDKETWGILSLYPDWRWGEFQKINPYKSLKLFKQNKFNDWHDTISDIYNQLKIRLHKKKNEYK